MPVGTSLSGGLDSSAIVYFIDKIKKSNQVQKTFSARFKNFKLDEGEFMQEMIKQLNIDPYFVWLNIENFVNDLDKAIYHQEEPFGSTSIIASFSVYRLAKEHGVTVLMDGQGADELLGGYWMFFWSYFKELLVKNPKKYKEEAQAFKSLHQTNFFQQGLPFYFEAYFPGTRTSMGQKLKQFFPRYSPVLKDLNKDFANTFKSIPSPHTQFSDLNESLKYSTSVWGLEEILRCVDRNSMAFSREIRLPFLSHELIDYLFTLPSGMKIKNGWTKYIFRKVMENKIPDKITWRTDKVAYSPPQNRWMKDPRIKEIVHDCRDFLTKEKILNSGANNKVITDWQLITVGKFLQNNN